MIRYLLICLVPLTLMAFEDSDLDGVEDSIDRCLNTPILDLVDKNGCSKEQLLKESAQVKNYINYSAQIGSSIDFNNIKDKSKSYDFSVSFDYNSYNIYIDNSFYKIGNSLKDDLTVALGYLYTNKKSSLFSQAGIICYLNNKKNLNYFLSLNYSYLISDNSFVFISNQYIFNSKESGYKNRNYLNSSIGYTYIVDKYSLGLSLNYKTKESYGLKDELSLTLFGDYQFNDKYYLKTSYSYNLKGAYNHNISLNLGATFE